MSTTTKPQIKDSVPLILCKICIKDKGRSRKFPSLHSLKWHQTHDHGDEFNR